MSESYSVSLKQQPCVVKYVESWSSFLVGTYKLLETIEDAVKEWPGCEGYSTRLNRFNNRVGSLILLSQETCNRFSVKEIFPCPSGGVFDFKVFGDEIYVAHSNNKIGVYQYACPNENSSANHHTFLSHKNTLALTDDPSILLTSIDVCLVKDTLTSFETLYTVVGDSNGRVTILGGKIGDGLGRIIDKIYTPSGILGRKPCRTTDLVWKVKIVEPSDSYISEQLLILVGGESGRWYMYSFNTISNRITNVLTHSEFFKAGITSICLMPPRNDPSVEYLCQTIEVLFGSYDETVKRIRIDLSTVAKIHNNGTVSSESDVKLIDEANIKGGGIWQLMRKDNDLYIAAMYAGCYKTSCSDLKLALICLTDRLDRNGSDQTPGELAPLDYGIDVSWSHNVACVVDFNRKMCFFFKANKEAPENALCESPSGGVP